LGRWGVGVALCDEFDIEYQVGFWGNGAASIGTVCELIGDEETAFAADFHSLEAVVPTLNDAVGALDEVDGGSAIDGGVEFGAVMEPARVMDRVLPARFGEVAGSGLDLDVFQSNKGLGNAI